LEWVEFVGLIIMFLAFLLPAIGKVMKRRREIKGLTPEQLAEMRKKQEAEERRDYEQFLRSMGATDEVEALRRRTAEQEAMEEEEEWSPAPPPPPVVAKPPSVPTATMASYEFHSSQEARLEEGVVSRELLEQNARAGYNAASTMGNSRVRKLLRQRGAGATMILLHEVVSPPKSMRDG
jgi:hypothetical protein